MNCKLHVLYNCAFNVCVCTLYTKIYTYIHIYIHCTEYNLDEHKKLVTRPVIIFCIDIHNMISIDMT